MQYVVFKNIQNVVGVLTASHCAEHMDSAQLITVRFGCIKEVTCHIVGDWTFRIKDLPNSSFQTNFTNLAVASFDCDVYPQALETMNISKLSSHSKQYLNATNGEITAQVYGFGILDWKKNVTMTKELRATTLHIVQSDKLWPNMIEATSNTSTTCFGDCGGPLKFKSDDLNDAENGKVIGIMRATETGPKDKQCQVGEISLFTPVGQHYDWLMQQDFRKIKNHKIPILTPIIFMAVWIIMSVLAYNYCCNQPNHPVRAPHYQPDLTAYGAIHHV